MGEMGRTHSREFPNCATYKHKTVKSNTSIWYISSAAAATGLLHHTYNYGNISRIMGYDFH